MRTGSLLAIGIGLSVAVGLSPGAYAQDVVTYQGICEASAAVALGPDHFVVASDESNELQIYRRGQARAAGTVNLSRFLDTKKTQGSDLEAAATIGNRTYWISSHGRNKEGEVRAHRHRFFAMETAPGSPPSVKPLGRAYRKLLDDLLSAKELAGLRLAEAAARPPEDPRGGFNIEGLAATSRGELLVAFRNPIPDGLALVLPLANPKDVVEGKRARFGTPIRLNLGGRGVRSIDRVGSEYLIVAGPPGDDGSFALYRWSGVAGEAPKELTGIDLRGLHPEVLFAIPGTNQVQVLSDDGSVKVDGTDCKDQPEAKQAFRSMTITP